MHQLCATIFIFTCISCTLCMHNFTYVFSHLNTSTVRSVLRSNGFMLTNSLCVERLSVSSVELLTSIQTLLSSNDIESIAFSWNISDCSLPLAIALRYKSVNISSPMCLSDIPASITNIFKLTVTNQQLASVATILMKQYSLNYFSMIISESVDFYYNLAQEFSTYLTGQNFTLEKFLFASNFPQSSTTLFSKGLCSYQFHQL